jgi:hypothetical protein
MFFITVNTLMRYSVCTTFNAAGYEKYGRRMIQTFLQNWPAEVDLIVYAENCTVTESAPNLTVYDLVTASPELVAFKTRWRDVPKANGDVSADPARARRKDAGKGFKWDAVRFAHKVYSIFHCAKNTPGDWLLWMDADTVCHSPITITDIGRLCPETQDLCFLGRRHKYTECGLYAMRMNSVATQVFLQKFQAAYDDAETGIFVLDEWHDSFVFDAVRLKFPQMRQLDWAVHLHDLRPAPGMSSGEGHPLINSQWGAWLDHLKGGRKKLGRSKREDLKVQRTEPYWR